MQKQPPKQLAKFLNYVLSRRPDEFGLVTDKEGFVKIKELIKATIEEEGLKYVRRSHINEIMITLPNHGLEVAENLIRAINREHLPKQSFALDPPKLLYTCVREKAYPYVLDKGIMPTGFSKVILSSNRDLAQRMGRRSDTAAVLLTVQVNQSEVKGVVFFTAGESLFLADYIPPDCFSGPPLPKDLPDTRKADKPQKEPAKMPAGSFFLDLNKKEHPVTPGARQEKRNKKQKQRRERPPWRR
ncbi:MAG: RNA 2'-phosphotransferase [Proteobacteria bacterium]|nr:RNA 2'-phosphotransferase [Pseudomonadota bacterium]